jgi:uncharacterized protein YodC (DUF2158 family)
MPGERHDHNSHNSYTVDWYRGYGATTLCAPLAVHWYRGYGATTPCAPLAVHWYRGYGATTLCAPRP